MKPIELTLTGFCGIRDGLGRDSITLDLHALAGDARLVALAGANGRGKSTILDNLTPYPVMPSRAGADGLGAFSYYDNVRLSGSEKLLTWEMDGRRYRSHLVFTLNGKRRTEAYLHRDDGGVWVPAGLPDGTVSDGRMETYTRCVEGLLGGIDTFCTASFSAQGRRQLSAYRNAEIKALLADLLGLERIREIGARALETVRLVKVGLLAVRQRRDGLRDEHDRLAERIAGTGDVGCRVADALADRERAGRRLGRARALSARLSAERDAARHMEARRAELENERRAAIAVTKTALVQLDARLLREDARCEQLDGRIARRIDARERDLAGLDERRARLADQVACAWRIARAGRRMPVLDAVVAGRGEVVERARGDAGRLAEARSRRRMQEERIAGIERETGQAVLRAADLRNRFALTGQVPCSGTDLQGRCQLLCDARAAQTLLPSADDAVARLADERARLLGEVKGVAIVLAGLAGAQDRAAAAEARLRASRTRLEREARLAARAGEIDNAAEALAGIGQQIMATLAVPPGESGDEAAERADILAQHRAILRERDEACARQRHILARIDGALRDMPPPFDAAALADAERDADQAVREAAGMDEACLAALRERQDIDDCERRRAALAGELAAFDARMRLIENASGEWSLFAKCMSNDGLIALAIDDAGPELSCLANDLLRACYGLRFTVSIRTQVATGKGELREGFDIVVHDAATGGARSVTRMSGGERLWINESLTRAIALYLAQRSGRRSATLFSDEADGAFDARHKRMFMAMKREVLRIGDYDREYFITHTPELAAMADAIIDLDQLAAPAYREQ